MSVPLFDHLLLKGHTTQKFNLPTIILHKATIINIIIMVISKCPFLDRHAMEEVFRLIPILLLILSLYVPHRATDL